MCVHISLFIMLHIVSLSFCVGIYELKIVKCKVLNLIEITTQTHYVCIVYSFNQDATFYYGCVSFYAVSINLRHMILGFI